ncbi:MAG: hypothetical protein HY706_16545 [Candidatus Hydrogenedentes bacterium]|nr:hypothetical protein [Candidatus Hydrogenedentota bacterium]
MMRRSAVFFTSGIALLFLSWPALAAGYRTMTGSGSDEVPVLVVTGTPYEMGYALGQLMKDEVRGLLGTYLQIAQTGDAKRFSNETLDAAWESISPHTSDRFKEELRGVADGTGMSLDAVRRAHMVPVVADFACSGVAVWGKASANGDLYQIRNLDYETGAGLQDYPAVVIYIPDKGIPHVNVTFAGSIGVNTGMNAEGVALTEIGDTPGGDYPFDLNGVHFTTMFRDILYDAHNLDEAVSMIKQAPRIKKYHFIVGDGKNKKAVKMKAHAPELLIWNDNDPKDEAAPNVFENIVYHAEGRNPIAFAHLSKYQGKYDPQRMIELSKSVPIKGSNLLDVVYDATTLELWVAYAEKVENAYLRPYVHVKMKDYLPYNPKGEHLIVTKETTATGPSKVARLAVLAAPLLLLTGVATWWIRWA